MDAKVTLDTQASVRSIVPSKTAASLRAASNLPGTAADRIVPRLDEQFLGGGSGLAMPKHLNISTSFQNYNCFCRNIVGLRNEMLI